MQIATLKRHSKIIVEIDFVYMSRERKAVRHLIDKV